MIVGVCTMSLHLPACTSLKAKRQVLKSTMARVRNEFNVAIAEVDEQDNWQTAVLAFSCISTDAGHAHGLMERVVRFVVDTRRDIVLLDYETELL